MAAESDSRSTTDHDVERELIARVRAGDREAFGALVERHLVRAFALGFRVLHHREDAEDLVQDAFLTALEHIDAFDAARPFWPWLARIIVNRGLDLARARSVRVTEPLPDDMTDGAASPEDDTAERAKCSRDSATNWRCSRRASSSSSSWSSSTGTSVAEVADMLESSPSTVRWHLYTGRQRFRQALSPFRGDAP